MLHILLSYVFCVHNSPSKPAAEPSNHTSPSNITSPPPLRPDTSPLPNNGSFAGRRKFAVPSMLEQQEAPSPAPIFHLPEILSASLSDTSPLPNNGSFAVPSMLEQQEAPSPAPIFRLPEILSASLTSSSPTDPSTPTNQTLPSSKKSEKSTPDKLFTISGTDIDSHEKGIAAAFQRLGIRIDLSQIEDIKCEGAMNAGSFIVTTLDGRQFFVKANENQHAQRDGLLASDTVTFDPVYDQIEDSKQPDLTNYPTDCQAHFSMLQDTMNEWYFEKAVFTHNITMQVDGFVPILARFKNAQLDHYYEITPYVKSVTAHKKLNQLLTANTPEALVELADLIRKMAEASAKFTNHLRKKGIPQELLDSHPDGHPGNFIVTPEGKVFVIDCRLFNSGKTFTATEKMAQALFRIYQKTMRDWKNVDETKKKRWCVYHLVSALKQYCEVYGEQTNQQIDTPQLLADYWKKPGCVFTPLDIASIIGTTIPSFPTNAPPLDRALFV